MTESAEVQHLLHALTEAVDRRDALRRERDGRTRERDDALRRLTALAAEYDSVTAERDALRRHVDRLRLDRDELRDQVTRLTRDDAPRVAPPAAALRFEVTESAPGSLAWRVVGLGRRFASGELRWGGQPDDPGAQVGGSGD